MPCNRDFYPLNSWEKVKNMGCLQKKGEGREWITDFFLTFAGKTTSLMEQESIVLRSEGLVKRYGKRTVVNDVSFHVAQGEIVGLLGPNGAGKTTSFYMTTGLVVPNGGHIYLGDEEVTTYPVYKRARAGIGYLAQEASVFRKMSVEDNILSVLEMTGKPRDYQLEKLESLIKEFRLGKVQRTRATSCRAESAVAARLLAVWLLSPVSSCSMSLLPVLTLLPLRISNRLSGS